MPRAAPSSVSSNALAGWATVSSSIRAAAGELQPDLRQQYYPASRLQENVDTRIVIVCTEYRVTIKAYNDGLTVS